MSKFLIHYTYDKTVLRVLQSIWFEYTYIYTYIKQNNIIRRKITVKWFIEAFTLHKIRARYSYSWLYETWTFTQLTSAAIWLANCIRKQPTSSKTHTGFTCGMGWRALRFVMLIQADKSRSHKGSAYSSQGFLSAHGNDPGRVGRWTIRPTFDGFLDRLTYFVMTKLLSSVWVPFGEVRIYMHGS